MGRNYLVRRPGTDAVPPELQQRVARAYYSQIAEQAVMHSVTAVTESAMYEVVDIKRLQGELEKFCPDASELLALIASNGGMAVARRAHRFGLELW